MPKKCLVCGRTDVPDNGRGEKDSGHICSHCGDNHSVIVFCRGCGYREDLSKKILLEFDAIDVEIASRRFSIKKGTLLVINSCSKCHNGLGFLIMESYIIEEPVPDRFRWN